MINENDIILIHCKDCDCEYQIMHGETECPECGSEDIEDVE